jgi:RNA polymerase sigma-70 factor (ECF subfamily)
MIGQVPDWLEAGRDPKGDDSQLDIQLVQLAQGGDADAFGSLFERHAPAIFRYLYAHMDNREDAEDLTEEVFLRVWRSLSNYREQGSPFVAYLFRVARNALIDFYRRSQHAKNQISLEDGMFSEDGADPGDVVLNKIDNQEVRNLLSQLREEYRTVLVLRFLGDLSPDETAQVMGKSAGAVRVLQHRALAALRKLLS